jgi:hypothetical protein
LHHTNAHLKPHLYDNITHSDQPFQVRKRMSSFSIEEFIGNGVLKELLPKLLDEGWDDVPTMKVMDSDDMNSIKMTQRQKVGYSFCQLHQTRNKSTSKYAFTIFQL